MGFAATSKHPETTRWTSFKVARCNHRHFASLLPWKLRKKSVERYFCYKIHFAAPQHMCERFWMQCSNLTAGVGRFFCESIVDQLFCRHFHATTTQVRRVQKAHRKQVLSVSHTLNQVLKDVFVQCGQRQIHIFFFKLTEELLSMCTY